MNKLKIILIQIKNIALKSSGQHWTCLVVKREVRAFCLSALEEVRVKEASGELL